MLVIALISIISAIAIPTYKDYKERAQVAACIAEIRIIEKSIIAFMVDEHRFPDNLVELSQGQLKDPWGNPYRYLKIEGGDPSVIGKSRKDRFLVPINSDFDLYSAGKDGDSKPPLIVPVSADDIIRANDGQFVGLASRY